MEASIRRVILACLVLFSVQPLVAQGTASLVLNEILASNAANLADGDGAYSDWIEIANPTAAPVSLAGCYLTDDATDLAKWPFPASASVPANGYLIVFASNKAVGSTPYIDPAGYIHTSFKLSAAGESIALVASDATTVVSAFWNFPLQGADVSYGVGTGGTVGFFRPPTPGAANGTAGNGFVEDTTFSTKRCLFSTPISLSITCPTEGATIRYTTDFSTPSETNGTIYTVPIGISHTTVVRAIAYKTGWTSTNVDTHTYINISDTIAQPATKPSAAWPDPGSTSGRQAIDYAMDTDITASATYSALVDDALLAVPTISLVSDLPNLFDATTGIYMNPGNEGVAWERPCSVELINPDGTAGFHVNAGMRIRGGSSASKTNPKHSFRVLLKSEYGDSKINYPMLGPNGPDKFDNVDLRTAQNFSWNNTAPQYATYVDDPFTHDTFRDMGHPSTEGFFFHLYLDGQYWGLYQTEERASANFMQSHVGGADTDYDVLKSDEDTGVLYAVDGSTTMYFNYWTLVNAGVTTAAAYLKLQGLNADGTPNATYPKYLDVDNLVDYMLIVFFTGAQDMPLGPPMSNNVPRNLYAAINRVTPDGVKYIPHDNEWSLLQQSGVNLNRVSYTLSAGLSAQNFFNPWWLHSKLKANAEYALRFADRVHKHLFNGGVLTPSACTARYQARTTEINTAIIAESARWGDYLTPSTPRTRNVDWVNANNWVVNNFFNASPSTRTAIVLSQLTAAGLYPGVAAPEFSSQGGTIPAGTGPTVTAAAGTIYYTTNGTDPRLVGGAVNGAATTIASGSTITLNTSTTLKARVLNGGTWSALSEATFVVSSAGMSWTVH